MTPDNPPVVIAGTSGAADLMILKTQPREFNQFVCQHVDVYGVVLDCESFGAGWYNVTILLLYLQTHPSQVVYSQTIVNQNVTINYPVTSPTNIILVLAHLGPDMATDYWQTTISNQTVSYPLIGITETQGTVWNLANTSLGLIAIATVALLVTLTRFKTDTPKSEQHEGPSIQKCPACGQGNMFFAEKCGFCGLPLQDNATNVQASGAHKQPD